MDIKVKRLSLLNLNKSYGERFIFKNVNFVFEPGSIYAFLAPNGSGKTTLMRCIAGINSYQGLITYGSEKVVTGEFNDKIVFSPSTPLFEKFSIKVIQYIRQVCILRNIKFSEVLPKFEKLPIFKFANSSCQNLSTGEKKMLQNFVDLISDPDFIMFDEPLNGLDHNNRQEFILTLRSLVELKKTIIFSTHIINDIVDLANHIIIIKNQQILSYPSNEVNVKLLYEKNYNNIDTGE